MCGILGFFSANTNVRNDFQSALKKISHRGPNGLNSKILSLTRGFGQFGHSRLSVIDLTELANQPMTSKCGNFTIIFNGEIYNYKEIKLLLEKEGMKFFSDSDTEVLLNSWIFWGEESMEKIQGMFAFAIFDNKKQKVICVRDAFGIKPFYYCIKDDTFCFSSEIPPILDLLPDCCAPNYQISLSYLKDGLYDHTNETFFNNVMQLMPGGLIEIDFSEKLHFSLKKWWNPSINLKYNLTFDEASKKLRNLFLESVRFHLRSDVPIGAALSGGIDSSAIVCGIKIVNPDLCINTFSFIADGNSLNEEKWVDIVNRKVQALEHKLNSRSLSLDSNFDEFLVAQGEPFGSTSIFAQYCLFELVQNSGITVTLDGQGADEIFAGYRGYPAERIKSLLEEWKLRSAFKLLFKSQKIKCFSKLDVIKNLIYMSLPVSLRKKIKTLYRFNEYDKFLDKTFVLTNNLELNKLDEYNYNYKEKGRRLMFVLREMLSGKGLGALLRHADRNSMHWGIESRVPFLNTEIVNFVLGLPEEYLYSDDFDTKYILREALKGIVPEDILARRDKIGFEAPEKEWLIASKPFILEVLNDVKSVPILNYYQCKKLIDKYFKNPNSFDSRLVWRIVNYSRWYKINFVNS
jgi:asparagine synthase (glutamine-hydrolysing)